MTTTKPTSRSYAGAAASAAVDAAFGGAWTAAGGLTTTQRRVARVAVLAAAYAANGGLSRLSQGPQEPGQPDVAAFVATSARLVPTVREAPAVDGEVATTPDADAVPRRPTPRQLAVLAGVTALSGAAMYGGRRLEKRWLAGLIAKGHPYPHLALGLRMAAVSLAAALPSRLAEVRATRRAQTAGVRSPS
jgi:hypothetical protein